jgi:hypothetical protein
MEGSSHDHVHLSLHSQQQPSTNKRFAMPQPIDNIILAHGIDKTVLILLCALITYLAPSLETFAWIAIGVHEFTYFAIMMIALLQARR